METNLGTSLTFPVLFVLVYNGVNSVWNRKFTWSKQTPKAATGYPTRLRWFIFTYKPWSTTYHQRPYLPYHWQCDKLSFKFCTDLFLRFHKGLFGFESFGKSYENVQPSNVSDRLWCKEPFWRSDDKETLLPVVLTQSREIWSVSSPNCSAPWLQLLTISFSLAMGQNGDLEKWKFRFTLCLQTSFGKKLGTLQVTAKMPKLFCHNACLWRKKTEFPFLKSLYSCVYISNCLCPFSVSCMFLQG